MNNQHDLNWPLEPVPAGKEGSVDSSEECQCESAIKDNKNTWHCITTKKATKIEMQLIPNTLSKQKCPWH